VCVLGFTPAGAGLIRAAGRLAGGGWAATAVLGAVALCLVLTALGLPLALARERLNRAWDLSRRDGALFWADTLKSLLVSVVLLALVSLGFYALVHALPGTWWIAAALGAAAMVFLMSFLVPVVVEPLFNRFTPLEAGPLRERLDAVVARTGVPVRDILVSDASRRTTALNAYVSGIGRTRRVVIWDTTIERCEPGEIAAVAAHELGHAARRDVVNATVLGAAGAAAVTALLAAGLHWDPLLRAAGDVHASDPRSLALLLALGGVLGAASAPLFNLHSRRVEARADTFALDVTEDPDAMVRTWRTLAVQAVSDLRPGRFETAWSATHPPIVARIGAARAWADAHGRTAPPPVAQSDPEAAPEEASAPAPVLGSESGSASESESESESHQDAAAEYRPHPGPGRTGDGGDGTALTGSEDG
jgi:STE24 endopeptidase